VLSQDTGVLHFYCPSLLHSLLHAGYLRSGHAFSHMSKPLVTSMKEPKEDVFEARYLRLLVEMG